MSIFTDLFVTKPGRSKQVLDHPVHTSTDFGKIIPILVEDVVPGDTFKCKTAAEIKLLPTLAPLRQGIEVRIDYFFVPNRLLWDDWQTFITGGEDGTDAPLHPFLAIEDVYNEMQIGSLYDYFGLPVQVNRAGDTYYPNAGEHIDALPFRAYAMIWNEYYRDQNLQDELSILKTSGYDDETSRELQYRGLKKDYFTSALPWTQRGPQVTIPIGGHAPVTGRAAGATSTAQANSIFEVNYADGFSSTDERPAFFKPSAIGNKSADLRQRLPNGPGPGDSMLHEHIVTIPERSVTGTADLSEATAVSINELRRLNSVQKWLERNARAGSRYVEQILSHFGVRTPDYRLDRPEYLGGGKQVLGMAEILQTSETSTTPQGTRAGVGFGNMLAGTRKYFVQEHGWVLGLMSIIPQNNLYADGLHRRWTRFNKFDYYFPEFQHLGEQPILNREIYCYNDGENMQSAFGYTPRYAEYRYHPGVVTGQMRESMSYWHMARLFASQPTLSGSFVSTKNNATWDRLFPTDEDLGDRFVINMHHFERLRRPMAKNPNPTLCSF